MKNEKIIKLLEENEKLLAEYHELRGRYSSRVREIRDNNFQALALLAELEKPHGWIHVSEGLPEVKQWVLCYWPSDIHEPFSVTQWWKHTKIEIAEIDFTHWMPIILPEPEKPKCETCGDTEKVYNRKYDHTKWIRGEKQEAQRRIPCTKCPPKAKPKDVAKFVKATKIHMEKYGDLMSRQWCKEALGIIESLEVDNETAIKSLTWLIE